VTFQRGIDGSDPIGSGPIRGLAGDHELRRSTRSSLMAVGTLACPVCDAPVALVRAYVSPADPLACPFCDHAASVRDFLSLTAPSRPARVAVRVVHGARRAIH
jgi:uncharacterized protein YbaR (Trm112 family)